MTARLLRPFIAALLLGGAGVVAGCHDMADQPRYEYGGAAPLFDDGKALQLPPAGTVAREDGWQDVPRPPLTMALLQRGRERYDIFCSMCHGLDGSGNGSVVARGFPRPADFGAPAQRRLDAAHLYAVIGQGHGVMYGLGDRVAPPDRWAIAAYVQALQRAAP